MVVIGAVLAAGGVYLIVSWQRRPWHGDRSRLADVLTEAAAWVLFTIAIMSGVALVTIGIVSGAWL